VWVALFERDALGKLRGDVIGGLSYFSNWYQIFIGAGYSAGNDFAPLRHLWSLAVEEQFYVVWPLVMLLFLRSGTRNIAKIAGWLVLAAVAVTVAVALLDHGAPQQSPELTPEAYWFIGDRPISKPDALYLSTISRSSGLLLGAAFAMVWRPNAVMRGPLRDRGRLFDVIAGVSVAVLGIMCVVVGFQPNEGVHGFLFNGGLFVTALATLGLIAAITHRGAITGTYLSNPVLLWIGTRSYGLYLYHWPIYQIIRNIAANKLALHEFVLAMVATGVITELSYRYVETPIRKGELGEVVQSLRGRRSGRNAPRNRGPVVATGALAAALTVFAGASLATAELRQNAVEQSLAEGRRFACDTLVDLDCDGVDDLDADGNPLEADGSGGTEGDFSVNDDLTGTEVGDGAVDPSPDGGAGDADGMVVPESTAPTTTLPTPSLIAVGDSVMLGAAQQLAELGFTVDAQESRAWINGLDYVQQLGAQDRLPDTMVIHLGTNGRISENDMQRMMDAVAEVPEVVLVTNDVDRDYTADNNSLIYGAAAANDNVQVLDWQGLVNSCEGDCLEADGYHLKPDGRRYYASLVAGLLGL
ncbi:MAG: acyltransferase family protein, partial [Actinomycetota bacterium]